MFIFLSGTVVHGFIMKIFLYCLPPYWQIFVYKFTSNKMNPPFEFALHPAICYYVYLLYHTAYAFCAESASL
jgi:hypothetical protein